MCVRVCLNAHTHAHVCTHTHAYMQGTCTHNVHAAKLTQLFLYSVLIIAVGLPPHSGDTESIWVTHDYTTDAQNMSVSTSNIHYLQEDTWWASDGHWQGN